MSNTEIQNEIDKTFDWHTNVLTGNRGPIDPNDPKAGFYRVKNGRSGPYVPVAFWYDSTTGELRSHKDGRSLSDMLARELWVYAAKNPISSAAYWHKIDAGVWLDEHVSQPQEESTEELSPVDAMKAEIERELVGVSLYKNLESDEEAAKAQTLRSHLTTLSGKADKLRSAEKEPHLQAGRDVDAKYQPIVKAAKDGADTIRKSLGVWEDFKRDRARKAQAETDKIAREHAEASRKAEEANQPPPPPPVAPIANTPGPSAQIKGASGRAASVSVADFVVDIDLDKCLAAFRGRTEVRELFMALADKSLKAKTHTAVELGATIEQRSVIR